MECVFGEFSAFIVWNVCHTTNHVYIFMCSFRSKNPITVKIVRHRLMHFVVCLVKRRTERKKQKQKNRKRNQRNIRYTYADRISTANQLSDDVGRKRFNSSFFFLYFSHFCSIFFFFIFFYLGNKEKRRMRKAFMFCFVFR